VTLALDAPYASLDDVVASLAEVERTFRERRDRRAIFPTAYLTITRAIGQGVAAARFEDPPWVARYGLAFANLYRTALRDWERGARAAVPTAWRIGFATSQAGEALLAQDLLLGVNAHINNDLPLALVEAGIADDRARRHRDHTAVNRILGAATDALQDRVCEIYAPVLSLLDAALGRLDEEMALFSVERAREQAWVSALALANARSDAERGAVRRAIDAQAGVVARLVVAGAPARRRLTVLLRRLERTVPWWRDLGASDADVARALEELG
jgi:hypothetical protein